MDSTIIPQNGIIGNPQKVRKGRSDRKYPTNAARQRAYRQRRKEIELLTEETEFLDSLEKAQIQAQKDFAAKIFDKKKIATFLHLLAEKVNLHNNTWTCYGDFRLYHAVLSERPDLEQAADYVVHNLTVAGCDCEILWNLREDYENKDW
jgi:hypothetical protein